jgi:hypothetical protein
MLACLLVSANLPTHVNNKVAGEMVRKFNPVAKIISHHGDIKDAKFGATFFQSFNLVMNALDNLSMSSKTTPRAQWATHPSCVEFVDRPNTNLSFFLHSLSCLSVQLLIFSISRISSIIFHEQYLSMFPFMCLSPLLSQSIQSINRYFTSCNPLS